MPPSIPQPDKKVDAQRYVLGSSPFCLNHTDLKRADYRCDLDRCWTAFDSGGMHQLPSTSHHRYKPGLCLFLSKRLIGATVTGLKWQRRRWLSRRLTASSPELCPSLSPFFWLTHVLLTVKDRQTERCQSSMAGRQTHTHTHWLLID